MKVYPPPFWQNRLDLDLNSTDGSYLSLPNLSSNAAFQGWMGVAGMNNFRKLYGYYEGDLEPGSSYKVLVDSRFVTISFQGRKYIVLTNNSYLGGKNPTLGITYLIVGILILLIAIFLLLCYLLNNPRKLGDLSQLSWVVAGAAVDSNEKEPEAQQRTNERSNIL